MDKLFAILALFRKGAAVADPKLLQDRGALVVAITAVLTAIGQVAKAFGYELPLDTETVNLLAGGLAAAAFLVVHYGSRADRGIPAARPAGDGAAPRVAPPPAPVGGQPADASTADQVRPGGEAPDRAGG